MNNQNTPQGWSGYGSVPQGFQASGQVPGQVAGQGAGQVFSSYGSQQGVSFGGQVSGAVPGQYGAAAPGGGQVSGSVAGTVPGQTMAGQFTQQSGAAGAGYGQTRAMSQYPQAGYAGASQSIPLGAQAAYGTQAQSQAGAQYPGQTGQYTGQVQQYPGQQMYGQGQVQAQTPYGQVQQYPGQVQQGYEQMQYPGQVQQGYTVASQGQYGMDTTQAMPYYSELQTMTGAEQAPGTDGQQQAQAGQRKVSIIAVASFVLALIALGALVAAVLLNTDAICYASLVVGVFAFIFGIVGIVGVVRRKYKGAPFAVIGTILSVVVIVATVLTQFVFPGILDDLFTPAASGSNTNVTVDVDVNENVNTNATDPDASSSIFGSNSRDNDNTNSASSATSEYEVKIDKLERTTDVDGKPAILVTYTWTNNSSEPTMFLAAVSTRAMQSGVELQTALVQGGDPAASTEEVQPGGSAVVTEAFALRDSSDVTIECTDMFSMDEIVIADRTFRLNNNTDSSGSGSSSGTSGSNSGSTSSGSTSSGSTSSGSTSSGSSGNGTGGALGPSPRVGVTV